MSFYVIGSGYVLTRTFGPEYERVFAYPYHASWRKYPPIPVGFIAPDSRWDEAYADTYAQVVRCVTGEVARHLEDAISRFRQKPGVYIWELKL